MIPVCIPELKGNELKYLSQCIEDGWISSNGPFVKQLEEAFSAYIGKQYGIAVSSGTAALETALFACGIKEGDEVILPTFTIISCAIAVLKLKAIPVLVDCEPETWNIDVSAIEEKINPRTKAIMPVHIYGHSVDMDPILELAKANNLVVIEDASEAHGAGYKGRKCGSMGKLSVFSFYANKIVTTGEGGMVLTDDPDMATLAKDYRNLCFGKSERFLHHALGYNFRMTNMQAAVGLAQLERIAEILDFKQKMGKYYQQALDPIKGIRFQSAKPWANIVYWMFAVELSEHFDKAANDVILDLKSHGIETRPFFRGLHDQPVLRNHGLFADENYPNCDHAYKYGLYLPSGMDLTKSKVDYICEIIKTVLKNG